MHTERREAGELSVERFGELWAASQEHDARRLGRDHRGLPHVVVVHPALHRARPATCTRTRTVSCSRCRCTRSTRRAAPTSCPQYLDLLRAGGSMPPRGARQDRRRRPRRSRVLGPRPRHHRAPARRDDRGRRGRGTGCHDVPRHPVEHRQRRRRRAALHHPPSRARARRACGCTRADKAGQRRGGAVRSPADGRARDQRRRRAARARRRLRLVHRDRRPAPDGRDHRHGADPARRARTSCRARSSPAIWPAAPRPADAHAAGRRVRDGRRLVLHVGHRPGLGERRAAVAAHRHVRRRRAAARDGDRQLQGLRAADGAVRDDGLRQAARRQAVAVDPGRACRSRGVA